MEQLRAYRIHRIRQKMAEQAVSLCILCNPVSLRYATDYRGYQLFQSHIPTTYLYISANGPTVLYGAGYQTLKTVDEYRHPVFLTPFDAGFDIQTNCKKFTDDIYDYLTQHGLYEKHPRIAIERFSPLLINAVGQTGIQITDAESIVEQAKLIKSDSEIRCIKHAIAVAEMGMSKMYASLSPGMTEEQLWSIIHQVNIANGGDWIEGRMLSSGYRTNPWLQEAGNKIIDAGELVAFDTDLIGPNGYCADISRTWLCESHSPNLMQKNAYQHAYDEIHHNLELLKPGVSFYDLCHHAFRRKPEYVAHRYPCVMHGVGMSDEYPKIYYKEDWPGSGYDGVLEENMVMCIESFSGSDRGGEGVKLEQMARVTKNGYEILSDFPFETDML